MRWTAYYGRLDALVRPDCARLPDVAGSVSNVLLPGEGHLSILQSARLWDDVFTLSEELAGIQHGTIKATVLIETLPAAFEMDEIL